MRLIAALACLTPFAVQAQGTSPDVALSAESGEIIGGRFEGTPDVLALTVSLGQSCEVQAEQVRDAAERAMDRYGIDSAAWPDLNGDAGWFGLYVGLDCEIGSPLVNSYIHFDVSFIESVDGKLQLVGKALRPDLNYGGRRLNGHGHGGEELQRLLPGMVGDIVSVTVIQFLHENLRICPEKRDSLVVRAFLNSDTDC